MALFSIKPGVEIKRSSPAWSLKEPGSLELWESNEMGVTLPGFLMMRMIVIDPLWILLNLLPLEALSQFSIGWTVMGFFMEEALGVNEAMSALLWGLLLASAFSLV